MDHATGTTLSWYTISPQLSDESYHNDGSKRNRGIRCRRDELLTAKETWNKTAPQLAAEKLRRTCSAA